MARKLEVEIVGDASRLNRSLQSSGSTLGKFGKAAALAGGAAALGAVVVGAKKCVDAASDLNESINAVNVVFGKASGKIQDFSENAAREAGLSMRELNQLVTPLGAAFVNMGDSVDVAADKSIALAKRAADMASVFNVDVKEALGAIQAGLRGEADPLERFGVGLSDAAVTAKALALGLAKTKGELTASDKAQARYKLLMEQTNKVAGDFKNTSGGLANQQRILGAELENLEAKIGNVLMPAITTAVLWIGTNWPAAMAKIEAAWVTLQPTLDEFATTVGELTETVKKAVQTIKTNWGTVGPLVKAVAAVVGAQLRTLMELVRLVAALLRGDWKGAWEAAKAVASSVANTVKSIVALAFTILKTAISGVVAIAKALFKVLGDLVGKAWKVILSVPGVQRVIDLVKTVFGWLEKIADTFTAHISISVSLPGGKAGKALDLLIGGARDLAATVVGPIGGRALGGPVVARQTYIVGERGPELFVPGRSGAVVPNNALGGGRPQQVNLVLDGRTLASVLIDPLRNQVKLLEARGGTF